MKKRVRNKIISYAVTEEMYALIKQKCRQLNMTPSTYSYEIQKNFLKDELPQEES